MKGTTSWSFAPYRPPLFESGDIYICRLYPGECRIGMDWLPLAGISSYTVHLRPRGSEEDFLTRTVSGTSCIWDGLDDLCDYEFYVSAGEAKSRLRLARTGAVPGESVVNYLHPDDGVYSFSGQFLCSPSFVRHPDGYLLASMDVYGNYTPQNLTLIFRSDDDGKSWNYVSELYPCFWGKLFVHRGALYMLGVSTEYGDLLIGRSDDAGKTFGVPTVLFRGTSGFKEKGIHKNPQPVVSYGGRLWETCEWGSWSSGAHAAMCFSIDENDDLLDASKWAFTPPLPHDSSWPGADLRGSGAIEGCMTVSPDGKLLNVMRYSNHDYALALRVFPDEPEHQLEFDHFIRFPGSGVKFEIKRDPVSGLYLSFVCYRDENIRKGRNLISLIVSKDMENWSLVQHIYDFRHLDADKIGFQYVDFEIEGDDILFLTRTAWNGAANMHDANYSIFSRIRNFRELLK